MQLCCPFCRDDPALGSMQCLCFTLVPGREALQGSYLVPGVPAQLLVVTRTSKAPGNHGNHLAWAELGGE